MVSADVRFVLVGSGHIAGVENPPAAGKYQYWTNKDTSAQTLEGWLETADETAGSWWLDWDKWLKSNLVRAFHHGWLVRTMKRWKMRLARL